MANTAIKFLGDKDVRNLMPKDKKYMRVVGEPKELYLWVNPTGVKTFFLKIRNGRKENHHKLGEFRPGIYSVTQARKDAVDVLANLAENNKNIGDIKGNAYKYRIKNLCENYIDLKLKKGNSPSYIRKISQRLNNFIIPSLGHLDAKAVTYSMLIEILTPIFDPENPNKSRLETIHRLISDLHSILLPAIRDGYLTVDPTMGLHKTFPTTASFAKKNGIDRRIPALTDDESIAEFLKDLKSANTMNLFTKRAIYLQILTANRPANTASARWADIDFKNRVWTIPALDMKMKDEHKIGLNDYAIKILQEQYKYSRNHEFVFPSVISKDKHIQRDTLSKSIRNLGGIDKYKGATTAHGFRATFRTICTLNRAKLLKLGITDDVIESCLAHKERDKVKLAYEREKATIKAKIKLMQWYGDYLAKLGL